MSDPNKPNRQTRTIPEWGLMQREMFWAPNDGELQPFDTGEHVVPRSMLGSD